MNLGLPNGLKLSSQWRVYTALKALNPDVIHVHMIPTLKYSALAIGLLSFSKKVYFPYIVICIMVTIRDC